MGTCATRPWIHAFERQGLRGGVFLPGRSGVPRAFNVSGGSLPPCRLRMAL